MCMSSPSAYFEPHLMQRLRPSRFEATSDAVNLIFSAKTNANPESSVGLMSMGGAGPEVLTTLTTDMGKILDGLHRTKIRGSSHFSTGINIAAVSLSTFPQTSSPGLTPHRSSLSNTGKTSPNVNASSSLAARPSPKMRNRSSSSPSA